MEGTPAPKGSCNEPRNQNDFDDFGKYTLIYGVIFAIIGFILHYFELI
ncbi:DUF3290 domain-containing protein [Aureibaculum algae]|uniref:DUF3290 domain-containing protein n=1 Tax=Aureibaculum algae TaxID=2584122 RepID=A0A5B7TZB4_9FLAO|nr:DUF3290 domain-containing protein [Aureibaculum algae]QCX40127.1 DUF3290 domain-containing protein [Aureibaculum algae]